MEGDIYHNGFGEDHLIDPTQEFHLELQHALLGDFNFPIGDFCFSNDAEQLQLKSALFDEDEGFNEDYDEEMLQHTVTTGHSDSQQYDSSGCGVELFEPINPATVTSTSVSGVASYLQAGSRDQDQCLPDHHIDNCYGNGMWSDDMPMQLISSRDHMMSSPVKVHEIKQLSREPSPLLQPMQPEDIFYREQSVSHDHPSSLPSREELISMPFYKFKRLLDNPSLSADDKAEAKAIRKKGKNKSAARHCRQRKMAMLEGLELEVATLQQQRASLARQKAQLIAEAKLWEAKCASFQ